jgi:hypothetical protein
MREEVGGGCPGRKHTRKEHLPAFQKAVTPQAGCPAPDFTSEILALPTDQARRPGIRDLFFS